MHKKCFNLNNLEKFENKPFIFERKSVGTENVYSYKKIIEETAKCIEHLQNYKVKNNVGIAIDIKEHSVTTCVLLLGILNHQCHFYCLDFQEAQDAESHLKSSGVEYVISTKNLRFANITTLGEKALTILEDVYFLYKVKSSIENRELCYTIATSGSTGLPKVVHVPYECIEPNIKTLSILLNIQEKDMIFLSSPATFDPFVVEFFLSLENGASILITSNKIRLHPQQLLRVMFPEDGAKRGVTLYQTTPSLFRLFGTECIRDVILSNKSTLRCLILGGDEFPSILEMKSWLSTDFQWTDKRIYNIYGITEVSCWSSIYEFDGKTEFRGEYCVPLGKPLDNLTVFRVVDEFGTVLDSNDCKGELEIGSSIRRCFIPQYDADITILESNDVLYRKTGDFVKRDSSGNIYYIGRANNTIKRFGKRLCLNSLSRKVEKLLIGNNISMKVICLQQEVSSSLLFYFVTSHQVQTREKDVIVNVLKENLESYEQPDKIHYGNKFYLNCHGKIDGKKIMQRISTTNITPLEIFKDFLINVMGFQLDEFRSEANSSIANNKRVKLSNQLSFIEAGGNSFQALTIATEITKQMDNCNEERKILEMLLDSNVTIESIVTFLTSCSRKLQTDNVSYQCLENVNKKYNLKLLWRCDLKKCIDVAPAVFEQKFVAVGSHSHLLKTVDATTGLDISCLELNDRVECPVVFATSELALVGCYDGFLYGFNFNNATILWKLHANGMIKAKPLIINCTIIVASYAEDYNILAFDLKSLTLLWSLKLGSKGIFSSPLKVTEESVLFCALDGTYALVEVDKGSIKWCEKLDSPIFSTATQIRTPNGSMLVMGEVKGKITLCRVETGVKITDFQTDGNIFSGLISQQPDGANHTLIIFGCYDKNVYCLKLEHGSQQLSLFRKFYMNSAVYSTPIVISNRYLLACSTKGWIVLLNLYEFNVLASYDLKAEIFSSPSSLSDKYFYVGCRDNYLYAFALES